MIINIARILFYSIDNLRNKMDDLIMNYFGGLHFVCGGCLANHAGLNQRRFKDYYGIQYSQDGELVVKVDDNYERTVNGPWALITRPGPLFHYGAPPGKQRLHAFVCFKGPRVKTYIHSGLLPLNPADPLIRVTRPARFLATFRQLVGMLNPLTAGHYHRAVHRLEDLLLQLHEQWPESGTFPEYWRAAFLKLAAQINAAPEQAWDFQAVAGGLRISYPHFRRLFRELNGLAPGQFLIQARLRQAAARLINTGLPLKVIAEQCGFDDRFYFSRLFKKYYRIPPRRYRREFREF